MADKLCILSIGGLDTLTGGGIVTDALTFRAFDAFPLTVLTSTVSIFKNGVQIEPVAPEVLRSELKSVIQAVNLDAVKIGLLPDVQSVTIVAEFLHELRQNKEIPVVLDPVFALKEDAKHSDKAVQKAICEELLPLADVITPNMQEWELLQNYHAQIVGKYIALKDVKPTGKLAIDQLIRNGNVVKELKKPRILRRSANGAGCVFSASITANITENAVDTTILKSNRNTVLNSFSPLDFSIISAFDKAKDFTHQAIADGVKFKGGGSVNPG